MKKILTILLLVPAFAFAQKHTHTVAPKESFSSIGRLYNINGRELANFNKLDYDKGLSIGQVLKLPATVKLPAEKNKPVQTKTAVAKTSGTTAIYHTVAKKETLYHISTLYGKVPISDIKKWNNLSGDGVNEGTRLIVGYKTADATLPANPVVKEETVKEKAAEKPVAMPEEKAVVVEEKPEPVATKPTVPSKQPAVVRGDINFNGGFFKNGFSAASTETESGSAGVFKSNSGWEDGKYYCLHNEAPENSIVKITNAAGRSVYAKVLDVIPDIKQNVSAAILISNAAAAELGMGENKFDCTITYSK